MSLRCLVFSSHQETSNPLIQALEELDIRVDHSAEIFAAIRELTSRSFDLIVGDLDEGPEAEFLLKTVHELRINKSAFVLAVVGKDNGRASGPHNRAELLITKPLIPDQIKYALLGSDRFLAAYMRANQTDATTKPRTARTAAVSALASSVNQRPPAHRH
jgi:DNA-binding response OmpR family regulator